MRDRMLCNARAITTCPYGCCRFAGNYKRGSYKAMERRIVKRRERNNWRKELGDA